MSEETLNNKEDDIDETSPNFDEFLNKLDHQPNTNLIEAERDPWDQELIKYKNSLDPLDEFYDLDDWSDDINLFMKGLSDPLRSDELWLKAKAKETFRYAFRLRVEGTFLENIFVLDGVVAAHRKFRAGCPTDQGTPLVGSNWIPEEWCARLGEIQNFSYIIHISLFNP